MAQLTPKQRYGIGLGFSTVLWIVPVSSDAPKLVTLGSLVGAIAGYAHTLTLAEGIADEGRHTANQKILRREVQNHELASEANYLMDAITAQYTYTVHEPAVMMLPAANQQQHDPIVAQLIELSQKEGWISASHLKRKSRPFRELPTQEIRQFFIELAQSGVGKVKGSGNNLEWSIDSD